MLWGEDWRFDSGQGSHAKKEKKRIFDFAKICYTIRFMYNWKNNHFFNKKKIKNTLLNYVKITLSPKKTFKIMTRLSESPNLSHIELIWDKLARRVWREYLKSESELFPCLKNVWEHLQSTFFQKLLERIPRIWNAVIKIRWWFYWQWCHCIIIFYSSEIILLSIVDLTKLQNT